MKFSKAFFLLLLPIFCLGQTTCVTGAIKDKSDALPFANITLVQEMQNDTSKTSTNLFGQYRFSNIIAGNYTLTIECIGYSKETSTVKILPDTDTLKLDFLLDRCQLLYDIKTCPICNKTDKVIRVDYGVSVHYNFGSKKKAAAFYKKIQRQGFETHYMENQEFLIRIGDEMKHEKLLKTSICDQQLFCKRDRRIF